jgi:CheY-like chemotaxis protein
MDRDVIMVVDDDESIVESLRLLLEYAGYVVMTADGEESLVAELAHTRPALILLDYWLSGSNGGEITKRLKGDEHTRAIPIVIISASYNIKELVEEAGADGFIPKPYDMQMLLSMIRTQLALPKSEVS